MKPHKIFAENPDPAAMGQFYEAMKLDCVVKGAVMPDIHKGYALPIGAVVATEGVIFPSWCGYDIGCGCVGIKTANLDKRFILDHKTEIFNKIFELVPTGVGKYYDKPVEYMCASLSLYTDRLAKLYHEKKADTHIGTLGSGNHFIEIGYDETDSIWVVVHSGSRGLGHAVASAYMALAAEGKNNIEDHHGFRVDSELGLDYIIDMNFCLEFALVSRRVIARRALIAVKKAGGCSWSDVFTEPFVDRSHNHIVERDGLWIHRKGATHAEKDMMGVIPGNMRDGSFIVRGLGNPESLWSSSHGAGRVLSRTQAKKSIKLETLQEQMSGIAAKTDQSVLDEAPDAYKNIFEVMGLQKDLVEIVHYIKPIISCKG
jgi:tRNA-splicing ligase RtcB